MSNNNLMYFLKLVVHNYVSFPYMTVQLEVSYNVIVLLKYIHNALLEYMDLFANINISDNDA